MHTILLVGNDAALLGSRAAVLNRTGCGTIRATIPEALAILAEREVKLVVLCHTVSELTCLAITRMIHERWPSTRVLQVLPFGQEDVDGYAIAADAVSDSRPEGLLKVAAELLGPPPLPPVVMPQWKTAIHFH